MAALGSRRFSIDQCNDMQTKLIMNEGVATSIISHAGQVVKKTHYEELSSICNNIICNSTPLF